MEKIIGTILLVGRHKNYYAPYHLLFTDTRVLALDANTAAQNAQSPFGNNKALAFLGQAAMMGVMGGGMMGMGAGAQNMKMIQGQTRWNGIKTQASGKPVVDYDQKEVTDQMLQLGNVSFPYEKIKSVQLKKALIGSEQSLVLDMGILASEAFALVNDAQSQVIDLVKKTPLSPKLKQ